MKVLIFSFLVACASAQWYPYSGFYPGYYGSQYHAQDALGQASYGFAHPGQAANHYRDAFGNQAGSWAYVNPEGKEVRVSYTADHRGFRVLSNDLPEAPVDNLQPAQDTPEVAAAKATLFKLQKEATDAAAASPASRRKRQINAVIPTEQFKDDLKYKSVDLNEDGFPDVEVKPFYPAYRYVTPYTMPYTLPYTAPYTWAAPVATAVAADAGVTVSEKASRKKRQVPFFPATPYTLPYTLPAVAPTVKYVAPAPLVAPAPFVAPAPLFGKTTFKTVTAEADLTAKTPADTNKFDLKEKSFDVVTPYTYHGVYPYSPYRYLW